MREDVKRSRAARKLVLPVNREIAQWQLLAARLRAMSSRPDASAQPLLNELDELGRRVSGHLSYLADILATAPRGAIEEGRVLDTVRALKSLRENLDGTKRALSPSNERTSF